MDKLCDVIIMINMLILVQGKSKQFWFFLSSWREYIWIFSPFSLTNCRVKNKPWAIPKLSCEDCHVVAWLWHCLWRALIPLWTQGRPIWALCRPGSPLLRRLRQENGKSKASLSSLVRLCSKTKSRKKKKSLDQQLVEDHLPSQWGPASVLSPSGQTDSPTADCCSHAGLCFHNSFSSWLFIFPWDSLRIFLCLSILTYRKILHMFILLWESVHLC